ncbi:MAG: hypothetical protein A2Y84_01985 [Candidatus Colwellbacteria bacterium RBG_13_48_8]|uniref:HTH deoR-type domain-containing protein n=1 Tax=Candidatus Colwellbacteria bacterium RBG_13_48_8 TaxID=1797685 RepID=A0A1G1YW49_9BACT|nr:MAG: hypothetical protein A2Y84_01985 [Candidatus Colwellbacteria bacterium RBG_13_48_8]
MPQGSYIARLAHDISFAVFRVAAVLNHDHLRNGLEKAAVELVATLDESSLARLERLVDLSHSIGLLGQVNYEVLSREMVNLRQLMGEEFNRQNQGEVDLASLLGKGNRKLPFTTNSLPSKRQFEGKSASKRQKEILGYLKQLPHGCRINEVTQNFPKVSGRTLRNDISTLVDKRLVERVGKGGPYSYLRAVAESQLDEGVGLPRENGEEIIFLSGSPSVVDEPENL